MKTMPLIPLAEVAARAGVSRSTVERMMARGEFIAAYQLPTGTLRFDSHELEQWLVKCRRTNTQPHEEQEQPQ